MDYITIQKFFDDSCQYAVYGIHKMAKGGPCTHEGKSSQH